MGINNGSRFSTVDPFDTSYGAFFYALRHVCCSFAYLVRNNELIGCVLSILNLIPAEFASFNVCNVLQPSLPQETFSRSAVWMSILSM
jgi:hypothetical protein